MPDLTMPDFSMPDVFTSTPAQAVMLDEGYEFTLPEQPWADDDTIDVTQQVTASWKNTSSNETETGTFQARLSLEHDHVRIVMIDDLGRRAIDIDWSTDALSVQTADWLPKTLDAGRMLADIVMVYWPLDVVRDALPGNMSIRETMGERMLRMDDNGRAYARIERPIRDVWQGVANLRNERFGYVITIRSQRTGSSS
ncbi:DUF3261 domain-containing protein [Thalassospira sp. A3_1]|uniref:DUF3261 domain-containing protein n=1 Tax=Thalassospira sp. A3_1 TaxID=2821088 RepID=UPI001AD98A86|nr:DUF3261 domain-containing protein [Thalassospira sp. A3_1]MBO9509246.1 DUF3261 domain-containing protein [Thalassospira sp. A3_1]